jgi:hypothetical protein
MSIKSKLQFLVSILSKRQVGNTTLQRMGTDNYDRPFVFVAHKLEYSRQILENSTKGKPASINSQYPMVGFDGPVAVDHHLIHTIATESLDQIDAMEMELEKAKGVLDKVMKMAERYQDRCHRAEDIMLDLWLCPWWNIPKRLQLIKKAKEHYKEVHNDPYWGNLDL